MKAKKTKTVVKKTKGLTVKSQISNVKTKKRGRPEGSKNSRKLLSHPNEKKSVVKKVVKALEKIEKDKKLIKKPIPSDVNCACGINIPQQRLDACPGTTKCVNCSDVKTKKPIIINHGTGDNIYQETVIVDDKTFREHQKVEEATRKFLGKGSTSNFIDEEPQQVSTKPESD